MTKPGDGIQGAAQTGGGATEPVGGRRRSLRALTLRVLLVQALTLLALWLLQAVYG